MWTTRVSNPPFTPEALDASPLAVPADGALWEEREENGLRWLEKPAHGLRAPVYITGPATSTLDVARILVEKGLFPERMSFTQVRLECMEPKLPTTQCASVTF